MPKTTEQELQQALKLLDESVEELRKMEERIARLEKKEGAAA